MNIKINRMITEPPKRDYSKRDTSQSREDRDWAVRALKLLEVGQSAQFTGKDISRDRINGYIAILQRQNYKASFATALIPGGIGVWRVS